MTQRSTALYIVVCAAGAAPDVGTLVSLAQEEGWTVQIIATPSAVTFIDSSALEKQTGRPVRSTHRKPGQPRSPKAGAVIVAPATFNTINKLAHGIADNYALSVVNEAIGLGVPVVVLPFVNSASAARLPFQRSVESLRDEGVAVLIGPGKFEPHPPGSGEKARAIFPWASALHALQEILQKKSVTS